jgi:hypothetical protein
MPNKMMVLEPLLGVENCTQGVEYAACPNQSKKWGRGLSPKEREEDNNHPTHNEVDCKANGWN